MAGRLLGASMAGPRRRCRASVEEGGARPLAPVPRDLGLRRAATAAAAGDPRATSATPSTRPRAGVRCCDVCDPGIAPERRRRPTAAIARPRRRDRVGGARRPPAVGRTTCAEILHGARTKKIERNSYDGLPAYGTSSHMRRADILARVDELIEAGELEITGGPYPVLRGSPRTAGRLRWLPGRRTRVRGGLEPPGDARHCSRTRRDRGRRGVASSREEARGLERAREAGVERAAFAIADHADRDGARRGARRLARRARGGPGGAGRLHGAPRAGVHPPLRGADRERASVAAAGLPGGAARSSRRSSMG